MRTIYKYPLVITEKQSLHAPASIKILGVQMQQGVPTLWAEVETDSPHPPIEYPILCYGTGHKMPTVRTLDSAYIGTVQDGPFVWHFYQGES